MFPWSGVGGKEVFIFLIPRMEKLVQSWKSMTLSHGGKETLLKSVLQIIPTYIMSCFLLPKHMTKKMNSLPRAFFWGGSVNKKVIHWTKGSVLSKPKQLGGLGFKEFHDFNLALLAKQGWRLTLEPDQLWAKLLKALYFPRCDFMQAGKGKRASWIWASFVDARPTLMVGARKDLIGRKKFRVGVEPWTPTILGFKLSGNHGRLEKRSGVER
ncbi:Uncharacterized mitochondrial protein AtMg00310 [Linum perenne]